MAVTIHVNGKSNSLVHKGSMGIAKSTLPDVCKTPSPGGPVPVPYPVIVSMSSDLKKGTKTVKVDGKKMAAVKGSEFSRCTGDEPGTAGGVKSSTNMKEATWILYSFDVKLDGKNACRLSDKMMMNHGNTACLSGVVNPQVVADDEIPDPPGDCDPAQFEVLNNRVRKRKKHVQTVGPCRVGDSTAALAVKGQAHKDLADARTEREETCFRGGDTGHRTQIAIVKEHARRCDYIKRTGKAPRWRFPD